MKHFSAKRYMKQYGVLFADICNVLLSFVLAPTNEVGRINFLPISGIFLLSLVG